MKSTRITKFAATIVLTLICVLGIAGMSFAAEQAVATDMRIMKMEGVVGIVNQAGVSLPVVNNMKLVSGTQIRTESNGYCWIGLDESKFIKLDHSTYVSIEKSGKSLKVNLGEGKIFFNVTSPLKADEQMNICTSTTITGIRGTMGLVSIDYDYDKTGKYSDKLEAKSVQVSIYEGLTYNLVSDPITREFHIDTVQAGQKAQFIVYAPHAQGSKSAIIKGDENNDGVPKFICDEVKNDPTIADRFDKAGTHLQSRILIEKAKVTTETKYKSSGKSSGGGSKQKETESESESQSEDETTQPETPPETTPPETTAPGHEHTYNNKIVIKHALNADGRYNVTYKCDTCDNTKNVSPVEEEDLPEGTHIWEDAHGFRTEIVDSEHIYVFYTCKKCSICDKESSVEEIDDMGIEQWEEMDFHDYNDKNTCEICKYHKHDYKMAGHKFQSDENSNYYVITNKCDYCKETEEETISYEEFESGEYSHTFDTFVTHLYEETKAYMYEVYTCTCGAPELESKSTINREDWDTYEGHTFVPVEANYERCRICEYGHIIEEHEGPTEESNP